MYFLLVIGFRIYWFVGWGSFVLKYLSFIIIVISYNYMDGIIKINYKKYYIFFNFRMGWLNNVFLDLIFKI